MLNNVKIKNGAGFTLIEVIVAIFIITVGVGGTVTLINQTISFTQITSSKLVATYLVQEGIEIVKNIRDSNFLEIHKTGTGNWTDDLDGCSPSDNKFCEGDYAGSSLTSYDVPFEGNFLEIGGLGFYNYGSGIETPFKRKITITPGIDILEVLVEVIWEERGRTHIVTIQEDLYKWW